MNRIDRNNPLTATVNHQAAPLRLWRSSSSLFSTKEGVLPSVPQVGHSGAEKSLPAIRGVLAVRESKPWCNLLPNSKRKYQAFLLLPLPDD